MTMVRLRASVLTVLLAATLALVLVVEKPARAQGGWEWGIPVVNMPASWWTYMGATAGGATVWVSPLGAVQAGGSIAATAQGTAGVVAAGGTTMAVGSAVVATGLGIGLGWGAYEAGIWKWLGCDHVLNTGSSACPGFDPVEPTTTITGFGNEWFTEVTRSRHGTSWPDNFEGGSLYYQDVTVTPVEDIRPSDLHASGQRFAMRVLAEDCEHGGEPTVAYLGPLNDGLYTAGTGYEGSVQCGSLGYGESVDDQDRWELLVTGGGGGVLMSETSVASGEVVEDRRIEVRVECTDYGDPAEPTMTDVITTPAFAPGEEANIPGGSCPDGWTLTDYQAVRTVDGQPEADEVLFSHPGPTGLSATDPEAECYDGSCEVMIHKMVDGQPQTCSSEHVNCLGWMDAYKVDPTQWQCLWGGTHVLPISDCEPFEKIDQEGYTGPTVEDEAGTAPKTDTAPGTASNPTHVEDGCGGFSIFANVFSTLAKGTACALQWAFVPSPATMDQVESVRQSLNTKPPVSYASAVGEWFGAFGDIGTECWVIEHHNSFGVLPVMNSCDQSNGMVSWMTSNRGLLNIIVWLLFLTPFAWWAWAQYAPGSQGDA